MESKKVNSRSLADINAANRRSMPTNFKPISKDIAPTDVKVGQEYWDKYNENWITVTSVNGYEVRGKTESGKTVTVSASQLGTEEGLDAKDSSKDEELRGGWQSSGSVGGFSVGQKVQVKTGTGLREEGDPVRKMTITHVNPRSSMVQVSGGQAFAIHHLEPA